MTGDQWFKVIQLILWLGFGAFILYGVYKIMTRKDI